jgi:hypothetical protein
MTRRITSTPFLPGECCRPSNQVILRVYLYPFIKATQIPPSLSGIGNKTMVTPTGKATTTVVNKTTVPFNQTMVTGDSNQSQQQTSNATTPTPHAPTSNTSGRGQANQSQEQGSGNPLSNIPVLGSFSVASDEKGK